jgi:hypothetical protein
VGLELGVDVGDVPGHEVVGPKLGPTWGQCCDQNVLLFKKKHCPKIIEVNFQLHTFLQIISAKKYLSPRCIHDKMLL